MVKCTVCGRREAVIYQQHTGRALCEKCFINDIYERVVKEIKKWSMFTPKNTLLLGLSGGKDSYVLLDILANIHPVSKIIAVSIIEGVPGYNRESHIRKLKEIAKMYGVDVIVTSIKEYTGHSLAEIVYRAWKRNQRISPCTYCGISRRRILNFYARMFNADKTVTAHNLDDEVQTAIVNLLRGDRIGLLRLHPLAKPASPLVIPRVKPLRKIYEWETATYAYFKKFPMQETECMFINYAPTLRAKVREVLYKIETSRPGTLLKILELLDNVLAEEAKQLEPEALARCSKCGEPTSPKRKVCKLCEILGRAGINRPVYSVYYSGLYSARD